MATNAERKAAHDKRMREAGLKRVTLWVTPENEALVKQIAKAPPIDKIKIFYKREK